MWRMAGWQPPGGFPVLCVLLLLGGRLLRYPSAPAPPLPLPPKPSPWEEVKNQQQISFQVGVPFDYHSQSKTLQEDLQ